MNIQNLDQRMLAYAFKDKKTLMSMTSLVNGEYFRPEFRALWELIFRCFSKYKEVPTINILSHVAGAAWDQLENAYKEVNEIQVDVREYLADLEEMKFRYNDQLLRKAGQSVFQKNWNGSGFADLGEANKVLRDTVSRIDRLYHTTIHKEGTLSETSQDAWLRYKQVKENPELAAGVHVGLAEFDRITNGLGDSDLLLIGGESGTGKSALAMNMAVNAWLGKNKAPVDPDSIPEEFLKGRSVVYFTVEMPYSQLERRLHACIAGIPLYGLRDGTLDENEEKRYRAALRFTQRFPHEFRIIDIPRGATIGYIENKFAELKQDVNLELIVVDYLNLLAVNDGDGEAQQDWLKIGNIAEQAHELIRVHHVPLISPAQLNRTPKEEAARMARPDQDRLARSLMLAQNASIIMNIEKRKDEHLMKDMKAHIVKMRDGEQSVIVLQKRLDLMRLYDCPTDWDVESYEER